MGWCTFVAEREVFSFYDSLTIPPHLCRLRPKKRDVEYQRISESAAKNTALRFDVQADLRPQGFGVKVEVVWFVDALRQISVIGYAELKVRS